ncbi:MAG: TetR/AcrR family transcriptional regulator [Erysipelotrichaceae bacterium]|jgi:AcrR family transcriptional regulator|nr:TetR/AcrR family transcriptional regulator [Erysipelotrichaceae bacterium]
MAQVLKPQIRERLLDCARQEFYEYGISRASLRRIAEKAKMTPGNVYRYFKNKDELLEAVTLPAMVQLTELLQYGIALDWGALADDVSAIHQQLGAIISHFLGLVDSYQKEVIILLDKKEVHNQFILLVQKLARAIMSASPVLRAEKQDSLYEIMADLHTQSVVSGVVWLFEHYHQIKAKSDIHTILQVYLDGYVDLLSGAYHG